MHSTAKPLQVEVIFLSALAEVPIDLSELFMRHTLLVGISLLQYISSSPPRDSFKAGRQGTAPWPKTEVKGQQGRTWGTDT